CLLENFTTVLEAITLEVKRLGNPEPSVIINGDFNLPNVNWTELSIYGGTLADRLQANALALFSLIDELMLRQIIDLATLGQNTLDLFFTNNEDIINGVRAEDPIMSDHRLLVVETTLEYWPTKDAESSKCLFFSTLNFFSDNTDWSSINNAVADINWNKELRNMTTTEM
ncbi:hypothetical protein Pcinc_033423, partial [Petrolisthes cinctipes]